MKISHLITLLFFFLPATFVIAEESFLSDQVIDYSSEAMKNPELDVIAVVCISKDMHLRMGYFNPIHSEHVALKTLRVLPVYVLDTLYSKSSLPEIIFIWDETIYAFEYWRDRQTSYPAPFKRLHPYPDEPVIRLVHLKKINLIENKFHIRNPNRAFDRQFAEKQDQGASLREALSYVGMEDLITTNNVFSLLDWNSVVPVEGEAPELPPLEPKLKLILSEHMIKQTDEANIYKMPKAFTEDVKVLIDRRRKKAKGLSVDDEEPVLKSDMGRKLSKKLMTRDEKTDKSK